MEKKRNAFVTARFTDEAKAIVDPYLDIACDGYGVTGDLIPDDEFVKRVQEVEVLIVELQQVTEAVIAAAPQLEVIGSCRGTPNNVDIAAATRKGIPVLFAPGRNAISVAELALGLMINLTRNVWPAVTTLRDGIWGEGSDSPFIKFRGRELYGKFIGVVGFGAIGREVAKRATALGMKLLVFDPYLPAQEIEALGGQAVDLAELLSTSDVVSLHAKAGDQGPLLGAAELALMKETAYLINTASGRLVDEGALLHCLTEHKIAGAGLDVFAAEPLPAGHPLLKLENVIATPHIGGATSDVTGHQGSIVATDMKRLLTGERPLHVVNPEVL